MQFISKAIHFASQNKHLQVQWQCVLKSVILYEVGLNKNRTPSSLHTFGVQVQVCPTSVNARESTECPQTSGVRSPCVYLCAGAAWWLIALLYWRYMTTQRSIRVCSLISQAQTNIIPQTLSQLLTLHKTFISFQDSTEIAQCYCTCLCLDDVKSGGL